MLRNCGHSCVPSLTVSTTINEPHSRSHSWRRATQGHAGWTPIHPSARVVDEARVLRTPLDEVPMPIRMKSATIFARAPGHF